MSFSQAQGAITVALAPLVRGALMAMQSSLLSCKTMSAVVMGGAAGAFSGAVAGFVGELRAQLAGEPVDRTELLDEIEKAFAEGFVIGAAMSYSPLTMWTAVGYGNIVAGMNLYNVFNDPNAGPIAKGLAIAGQVAALCPILAPSVVKKVQALLQAFCFPAGTEIATADGSKPIEEIREGDEVWAQSDRTGETALKRVKRVFRNAAAALVVLHCGTNTLEATPLHPLWVADKGWLAAEQVGVGDELWTLDGRRAEVTGTERKQGQFTVYNFEVEEFHTYFVGKDRTLAHNKCFYDQLVVSATKARTNLRAALGNIGDKIAHHIIPWEVRSHPFVQKAASGGFNINGANNGVGLDWDIHAYSGGHWEYNDRVWEKIVELEKANPNCSATEAANLLQQLVDKLRDNLLARVLPLE